MQVRLKQRYQIQNEISRRDYFEGYIDLEEMPRLGELLASQQGEISVKLEFKKSDYEIPMVVGQLQTCLQVECQRCLEPLENNLKLDFKLLVDAAEDIVRESSLDTVYSEEGYIDIFEVVEDEIILALPLVAMHENDTCNEHWQAAEQNQEQVVKDNPFSVLKDLKTPH